MQFSKDTKENGKSLYHQKITKYNYYNSCFFFVFLNTGEDPLSDLLESPGRKKPQQQLSNTAEVATTGHGGGSSKVGHSNKSKVMHDLFGLEDSPLKTTIQQKTKESSEEQIMANNNNLR